MIITLCGVCKNCGYRDTCFAKGKKDKECMFGQKYKCDDFIPNKEHAFYEEIKDKIEN